MNSIFFSELGYNYHFIRHPPAEKIMNSNMLRKVGNLSLPKTKIQMGRIHIFYSNHKNYAIFGRKLSSENKLHFVLFNPKMNCFFRPSSVRRLRSDKDSVSRSRRSGHATFSETSRDRLPYHLKSDHAERTRHR